MFKPELLSPAGTLKNMRYAFAYGADAVYAGQPRYSLRVRNNEFNHENLQLGINEAHALGKKFYVVVNIAPHNAKLKTFIRDLKPVVEMGPDALIMSDPGLIMLVREKKFYVVVNIAPHNAKLKTFIRDLKPVVEMGPDALIMSDPGLIMLVREHFPEMPIHLSVQANAVNWATVKFWQQMGLTRVILSRELSLEEIEEIRNQVPDMEIEIFVHGALCMAYSGRCLLSGYINKRDPNQGTLEEIEEIRNQVPDMEIEIFVHGALCMAYSGRCLLSGYINKRDPNQGTCTNACRWEYNVQEGKEDCMAYSGRCLLSGYINKRDPNQGTCTNACRWEYNVQEGKEDDVGNIVHKYEPIPVQNVEPTLGIGAPTDKTCTNACRWEYNVQEGKEDDVGNIVHKYEPIPVQNVEPTLGIGAPTDKVFMIEEAQRPGEYMTAFEDDI